MLVAAIHEIVSCIVQRSYYYILAEAVDEFRLFGMGFDCEGVASF